jgi:hypothetical protein
MRKLQYTASHQHVHECLRLTGLRFDTRGVVRQVERQGVIIRGRYHDRLALEHLGAAVIGEAGLVRLGRHERFDVVDVGAGEALQLGYLHDPDALHGLDHLLPLVDVAGQFAEPAVRQRLDKRGFTARLGQRQSYSAGTNPSIRCRRPSRAPMKMAAKVSAATLGEKTILSWA